MKCLLLERAKCKCCHMVRRGEFVIDDIYSLFNNILKNTTSVKFNEYNYMKKLSTTVHVCDCILLIYLWKHYLTLNHRTAYI